MSGESLTGTFPSSLRTVHLGKKTNKKTNKKKPTQVTCRDQSGAITEDCVKRENKHFWLLQWHL